MGERQDNPGITFVDAGSPASSSSGRPKRTHTRVACNACRSRKHKCNGDRPTCTGCLDRGTKCIYDADLDTTRAGTLRRRYETLEAENKEMHHLVKSLRLSPQTDVDRLIQSLRSGHSIAAALEHMDQSSMSIRDRRPSLAGSTSASARTLSDPDTGSQAELLSQSSDRTNEVRDASRDKRMQVANLLVEPSEHMTDEEMRDGPTCESVHTSEMPILYSSPILYSDPWELTLPYGVPAAEPSWSTILHA
ncbi:hypothetical protein BDZ85DRAFT_208526 [Elsinoe ampelina]|uniref:Zn(2)-C6 fungal-type domain-containing protein n=1 Tax=Elsinoe ampelina TaxID=302913 RepID=A0A6A6FYF7_9PEZI|nr:hypothetical protein BDZ85DRAFT_208526 [Elsinoe ampelina]